MTPKITNNHYRISIPSIRARVDLFFPFTQNGQPTPVGRTHFGVGRTPAGP